MTTIPIIDLNQLVTGRLDCLDKLASEFEAAFSTIGIAFLVNHPIPDYVLNDIFIASRNFHELPIEEKIKCETPNGFSGYVSTRRERMDIEGGGLRKPNQSDSFIVNNRPAICELDEWRNHIFCGKQIWPEHLKNFKKYVLNYHHNLRKLCIKIMPAFSLAMGLEPNYFNQFFSDPSITLRLLYYPPSAGSDLYGINPHADYGCFTLLLQDETGGLQVQYNDEWLDVPCIKQALVLNLGKIMSIWSNGHLQACVHRVINKSEKSRYSIPFFYDCNLEALIEPLIKDNLVDNKKPITHGEYIEKIIKSIYSFDD